MEAIVIALITVGYLAGAVFTFGPHQDPAFQPKTEISE